MVTKYIKKIFFQKLKIDYNMKYKTNFFYRVVNNIYYIYGICYIIYNINFIIDFYFF